MEGISQQFKDVPNLCQKHNLEPILTDYIYRISYKIAKKGKPCEMDLPLLENDTGPTL